MVDQDTVEDFDGFEEFRSDARPRRLKPGEVSLTESTMILAEDLAEAVSCGQFGRVALSFSQERRTVAIKPIDSEEDGYKLSYRSIASKAFYKHFGIHERGRFQGVIQNGILMVPLKVDGIKGKT